MNRTLTLLSALGVGLMTSMAPAQTVPPAPAAPAPAGQAAPPPQAIPAKIALISFEQAVFGTNEGQRAVQAIQQKYAPQKAKIEAQAAEVDALKKQNQSAPATLSDAERASRLKAIDTKEKALNRDAEDASQSYSADLQEAYSKLAQKVNATMRKYVEDNGYTLLLDVSAGQQNPVMWATAKANTDVTEAVIEAYNASSGVAAPVPSAPSAAPSAPAPAAAHPHTTTPAPRR
jgi:outer membrane protein